MSKTEYYIETDNDSSFKKELRSLSEVRKRSDLFLSITAVAS